MDLITLIVTIAVIGVALWLLTAYVPMPQPIKTIIVAVVAIAAIVWLLRFAGLTHV